MRYLLDVNVLVAWGWRDHSEHSRVSKWIQQHRENPHSILVTSAIPQLGFVRISVIRGAGKVSVGEAAEVLRNMLALFGDRHQFTPDNQTTDRLPDWCATAAQTTDAHLTQLAATIGAKLATCDHGIPDAYRLPR